MAEELVLSKSDNKKDRYEVLIPQLASLVEGEKDLIANLSNIAAALKETMNYFWVGFYVVRDDQLVLGPFQGPIACTRIDYGKGVCGTAWQSKKTVLVPNVEEFPGHIACNSASRSEIVVPALKDDEVFIVLDVDSDQYDDFDKTDQEALEKVVSIIQGFL